MVLSHNDDLRYYGFVEEVRHSSGNIAIQVMGQTDGMLVFRCGLRAGARYQPERHAHSHLLRIKAGRGIISIGGVARDYAPGDRFNIAGDVPHCFVCVYETTIYIQSRPIDKKCRP